MIVLDMDGVLVDFCQAAYHIHGRTQAADEPNEFDFFKQWGMNADEFWGPINDHGPEWWANIPTFPWAGELIDLVKSHGEFIIATASSHSPHSAAGKVAAMQSLFGGGFRDYFITPRKWLLSAPGRLLIDDNEDNCNKFTAAGGNALLFPQPWNCHRHSVNDRMKFVREWLQSWVAYEGSRRAA